MSLELLAPTSGGNKIPTVTWGGWPLVLRMSANREIGIGTPTHISGSAFPVYGETGLIVFEEPDECHSWLSADGRSCPENETYLAFTTYGTVPSLVLLSDAGPGYGGINLASHVTKVAYELDDTSHRTNVVASLTAPNGFVSPSVTVDFCVGPQDDLGLCPYPDVGRLGTQTLSLPELVQLLNSNNVATLRAFVVSRTAPTELTDLNGDGVIEAKDAELAGFKLLSREVVFQVKTLHQIGELFYAPRSDLDSNGLSECHCVPGAGGLTPVPR